MSSKKRRLGDRKDAYKVRDITGLGQLCIDLKPNRSVSDVYINEELDLTILSEYLKELKENGERITYFYAFLAAIGKVIYTRNKMNRFVANRHIYEHKDVVISFVAKIALEDKSEEVMVLVKIEPDDNIHTISKKVADKIDSIRNKKATKKGANNAIDALGHLPNIIRVPILGTFKFLDKKGCLPSSLVEDNLYYSSIIVSNLGSIGCGAIFHNINDFGSCSSLATIGEVVKKVEFNSEGKKIERMVCPFGINLDERIADGFYFAKTLQMLQYVFNHPELLEEKVSDKVIMDETK